MDSGEWISKEVERAEIDLTCDYIRESLKRFLMAAFSSALAEVEVHYNFALAWYQASVTVMRGQRIFVTRVDLREKDVYDKIAKVDDWSSYIVEQAGIVTSNLHLKIAEAGPAVRLPNTPDVSYAVSLSASTQEMAKAARNMQNAFSQLSKKVNDAEVRAAVESIKQSIARQQEQSPSPDTP